MTTPADVTALVPVRPVEFQILLSLCQGERHGYGIILDTEERTAGTVRLDVATLYRALRRLEAAGLVRPAEGPPREEGDRRRRDYAVTPLGRRVAEAEAVRLAELVRAARRADLLDGVGPA